MKRAFLWTAVIAVTFDVSGINAQDEPSTLPTSLPTEETSIEEPDSLPSDAPAEEETSPAETPPDMILDEVAPSSLPTEENLPVEDVAPTPLPTEEEIPSEPPAEDLAPASLPTDPPLPAEPPVQEVVPTEPPVREAMPAEVPPPQPARIEIVGNPLVSGRNATVNLRIFPAGGAPERTGRFTMVMYVVFNSDGSGSAGMLQATWDASTSAYSVTIDTEHEIQRCDATSVEVRHPETGTSVTVMVDFSWLNGC